MTWKTFSVLLIFMTSLSVSSCRNNEQEAEPNVAGANADTEEQQDLLSTIQGNTRLSRFSAEIDSRDVSHLEQDDREYTIFAPHNAAFAPLYDESGNRLVVFSNIDVLQYHVIPERLTVEQIRDEMQDENLGITTLSGERLRFEQKGESDTILVTTGYGTRAEIIESHDASNGVVHTINALLIPADSIQNNAENEDR